MSTPKNDVVTFVDLVRPHLPYIMPDEVRGVPISLAMALMAPEIPEIKVEIEESEEEPSLSKVVASHEEPMKQLSSDPTIWESPDMKFARERLGNLLTTRKHHLSETIGVLPEDNARGDEESNRRGGRPPGRPRKMMRHHESMDSSQKTMARDSKITFEVRGKRFQMMAKRNEEGYSLGRAWVKGVVNNKYEPINTKRTEFAPNLPAEYLARREIHRMPRPDNSVEEVPICPTEIDKFNKDVDPRFLPELRSEYLRHWKEVKKGWGAHQRRREARFEKNIKVIEKAYQPSHTSDTNDSIGFP